MGGWGGSIYRFSTNLFAPPRANRHLYVHVFMYTHIYICICVYISYTYVSFVLERGGRCNCVPKELSTPVSGGEMKGWFALLMAANNRDRGNYNSYLLSLMISMGADTHATHKGCNALFKAVSTGHQDAMYALLATDKFDPKALFKGETKKNIDTTQNVSTLNVTYLYIPIFRLEAAPAESL